MSSPEFPQVVCLGDINVDIIAPMPHYPELGGDAHAEHLFINPGGSATNTAVALSWLGVRTGLIGRVGVDAFGTELLGRLASFGLDLSQVQRDPVEMTGLMCIPVVPSGERTMFGCRGANARLSSSHIDRRYITQARLLHVSGYSLLASSPREAALQAMEWARAAGRPVSLDAGLEAVKRQPALMAQVLAGLSLLSPNEAEAEGLTGQPDPMRAVSMLLEQGVQMVVLKRGGAGCIVGRREGIFAVPGFAVQSVDSTGAGDAFDAGYIAGWLRGLGWRTAALLGNAMGALTTTRYGATPAGPAEIRSFLNRHRSTPAWDGWASEFDLLEQFLFRLS